MTVLLISMPGICDDCGKMFPTGIVGEGGSVIDASGASVGPCPYCGGDAHAPHGVFRFVEDMIEIISAPQRTLDELKRLSLLVDKANEDEFSREEFSSKVKEEVPELHPLLDWIIPQNQDQKFNLSLVLLSAVLTFIITAMLNNTQPQKASPEVIINNVYEIQETNHYYNNQPEINNKSDNVNTPIRVEKIGRNQLCPCGSGLKYKKCHGR